MALNDGLDDGQAQAGARHRTSLRGAIKALEDLLALLRSNARTGVVNTQTHLILRHLAHGYTHRAGGRRPFGSIVHEVQGGAPQGEGVSVEPPRDKAHTEVNVWAATTSTVEGVFQNLMKFDWFWLLLRCILTGKVNKVTNKRGKL